MSLFLSYALTLYRKRFAVTVIRQSLLTQTLKRKAIFVKTDATAFLRKIEPDVWNWVLKLSKLHSSSYIPGDFSWCNISEDFNLNVSFNKCS